MQCHQLHGIIRFVCLGITRIERGLIEESGKESRRFNINLIAQSYVIKIACRIHQLFQVFFAGQRFFPAFFFMMLNEATIRDDTFYFFV